MSLCLKRIGCPLIDACSLPGAMKLPVITYRISKFRSTVGKEGNVCGAWCLPGRGGGCEKWQSQGFSHGTQSGCDKFKCSLVPPLRASHSYTHGQSPHTGGDGAEQRRDILFFCHTACGILVPGPGIEPVLPAVEAWSLKPLDGQGSPPEVRQMQGEYTCLDEPFHVDSGQGARGQLRLFRRKLGFLCGGLGT